MSMKLSDNQFDELVQRIMKGEYCSPYHEEPMNEFIGDLKDEFDIPTNLRVIVEYLPYAMLDVMAAREYDETTVDLIKEKYTEFVVKSVGQILEFEMIEY